MVQCYSVASVIPITPVQYIIYYNRNNLSYVIKRDTG